MKVVAALVAFATLLSVVSAHSIELLDLKDKASTIDFDDKTSVDDILNKVTAAASQDLNDFKSGKLGLKVVTVNDKDEVAKDKTIFCLPTKDAFVQKCKIDTTLAGKPKGQNRQFLVISKNWEKMSSTAANGAKKDVADEFALEKSDSEQPKETKDFITKFEDESILCAGNEGAKCKGKSLKDKVAIFVLGPSAAGKTFSTTSIIKALLDKNNVKNSDGIAFHSLDGGKMREVSSSWTKWKYECMAPLHQSGCSDLFALSIGQTIQKKLPLIKDPNGGIFKKAFDSAKPFFFNRWLTAGENIVIVDTATGASVIDTFYTPLEKANYNIIIMAVYASKAKCAASGATRALNEGKQYSSIAWKSGVDKVLEVMSKAREKKNTNVFAIYRNNYGVPTPDSVKSDCDKDIMSHVKCGGSGAVYYDTDAKLSWHCANDDCVVRDSSKKTSSSSDKYTKLQQQEPDDKSSKKEKSKSKKKSKKEGTDQEPLLAKFF